MSNTFFITLGHYNINNIEDQYNITNFITAFCLLKKEVPVTFLSISIDQTYYKNNALSMKNLSDTFYEAYYKSGHKLLISSIFINITLEDHLTALNDTLKQVLNEKTNDVSIFYIGVNLNLHIGFILSNIPEIITANSIDFTPFNFIIEDKVNAEENNLIEYLFFKNLCEYYKMSNLKGENLINCYNEFKENNKTYKYRK